MSRRYIKTNKSSTKTLPLPWLLLARVGSERALALLSCVRITTGSIMHHELTSYSLSFSQRFSLHMFICVRNVQYVREWRVVHYPTLSTERRRCVGVESECLVEALARVYIHIYYNVHNGTYRVLRHVSELST